MCYHVLSVIKLSRLSGFGIVVNAELIESMEAHPDTTLSLATGSKIVVRESLDEVIAKIMEYRRQLAAEGKSPAEVLLKTYRKEG
jgi:flagellar protein FlbD